MYMRYSSSLNPRLLFFGLTLRVAVCRQWNTLQRCSRWSAHVQLYVMISSIYAKVKLWHVPSTLYTSHWNMVATPWRLKSMTMN